MDRLWIGKGAMETLPNPDSSWGSGAWWGSHKGCEAALVGYSLGNILTCVWVLRCRKMPRECPALTITVSRSRPGYTVRC